MENDCARCELPSKEALTPVYTERFEDRFHIAWMCKPCMERHYDEMPAALRDLALNLGVLDAFEIRDSAAPGRTKPSGSYATTATWPRTRSH
jgi:hypothetical protein